MSLRSLALQRCAVLLAAAFIVTACSENGREAPLSGVEAIDIPVADINNQTNQNIDNPTLQTPATFQVADGDLLTLVWNDEFDGAQLDPEVWFYETGDGSQYGFGQQPGKAIGWGNNELQYYLPDNAQLVNGVLEITARRESAEGYNFTSARINTKDRFAFKYGRIEASIKFPSGQGLWPAFWMLPQDSPYGAWAASGEIDIVEAVNLDGTGGNEIFSTIHFGGDEALGQNTSSGTNYTPSFDVTDDFHTYALEWDEFEMRWYVDGTLTMVENAWSSTAAPYPAPFDQPFHILFNLAVGGDFPGSPNGSTPFPATMEVDWVRVYSGEAPPVDPADPGIIPDDVIYATDPGEVIDLAATVSAFGTTSEFDGAYDADADFSPAFEVVSGTGYGIPHIAQLGLIDLPAGFAAGYESFSFKIKSANLPGNLITVKLQGGGAYGNVVLTDATVSTPLGNGWYQVVLPMSGFADVAPAVGVVFEAQDQNTGFSFLLTDIGFSGVAGGGGNGSCPPVGAELATNGDFEAGDLSCWESITNGGTITADNTQNNTAAGTWSAHVVTAGASNPTLKQNFLAEGTVQIGDVIDISFDMKGTAGAGGIIFPKLISEGAGGSDGPILQTIDIPTADWTTYTYSPTITADVARGITFEISVVCGAVAGCTADVFIDNVTVQIR